MGRSATGGGLAAPIVKQFLEEALKDVPPAPFRAPPGAMLVRVNHKTGLPARSGDGGVIMEAFKPSQVPDGVAAVGAEGEGGGIPGEDFPEYPDAPQAGPPPGFPPPPGQYQPPPRGAGFPGGPPSNDRALTSGTGGLY
jgi:penicillin-binding protein 1A